MILILRAFALALVSVTALCALGASAASAAYFHSEAETTTITATQTNTHKFTTTAGEVTCEKATLSGTQSAKTVLLLELTPQYSGCHLIVFGSTISATVNHGECKYRLDAGEKVDIVCSPLGKMTVTASGCTISIGSQTGLKATSFSNTLHHWDMLISLKGISYSHTGFICGTGSGTTGTYTGNVTASGKNTSGFAVDIET